MALLTIGDKLVKTADNGLAVADCGCCDTCDWEGRCDAREGLLRVILTGSVRYSLYDPLGRLGYNWEWNTQGSGLALLGTTEVPFGQGSCEADLQVNSALAIPPAIDSVGIFTSIFDPEVGTPRPDTQPRPSVPFELPRDGVRNTLSFQFKVSFNPSTGLITAGSTLIFGSSLPAIYRKSLYLNLFASVDTPCTDYAALPGSLLTRIGMVTPPAPYVPVFTIDSGPTVLNNTFVLASSNHAAIPPLIPAGNTWSFPLPNGWRVEIRCSNIRLEFFVEGLELCAGPGSPLDGSGVCCSTFSDPLDCIVGICEGEGGLLFNATQVYFENESNLQVGINGVPGPTTSTLSRALSAVGSVSGFLSPSGFSCVQANRPLGPLVPSEPDFRASLDYAENLFSVSDSRGAGGAFIVRERREVTSASNVIQAQALVQAANFAPRHADTNFSVTASGTTLVDRVEYGSGGFVPLNVRTVTPIERTRGASIEVRNQSSSGPIPPSFLPFTTPFDGSPSTYSYVGILNCPALSGALYVLTTARSSLQPGGGGVGFTASTFSAASFILITVRGWGRCPEDIGGLFLG